MKQADKILLTVFTIAIVCFTINPAKAQQRQQQMAEMVKNSTPEQRAKMQTTMMATKLSLDSATRLKVYDANLKAAQKMDPVIKGDGRGLAKMRKMKSIEEQKDKDMKAALSPDQYKQYETMKEEIKEKMKEKMEERKEKN
jgi:hypothetical protein